MNAPMPPPDFAKPALDFDGMLTLGRALVAMRAAIDVMRDQLSADTDDDPTVLALRAAYASLEINFAEEVPPGERQRIAALLHSEQMEPGHA